MKTISRITTGIASIGLGLSVLGSVGCATHERVVVLDRPEVVRVEAPAPAVQERVIVRP